MSDIKIQVNGVEYTGFVSAIASRSVESMAGKFSFTTTVKADSNGVIQNDLKAQDEVKIFIGDSKFLTGKIEKLQIYSDVGTHSISVSGRDRIGDLIDSSIIQKSYKIRDLKKLIEKVLKDNGFSDIKVINNVKDLVSIPITSKDNDDIQTEEGETIAQFIDRYAEKLTVLIYSDEDGNLTINREGSEIAVGGLLRQSKNNNSNILSSSIDVDITQRFQFVEVYSQDNNDTYGENSVNPDAGKENDSDITTPRRKIIFQRTASQTLSLKDLAKWNVAIRRAKGSRYQCKVQNFFTARNKGFLWNLNTLVSLKDDVCQVEGQFLIQGVSFSKTLEGSYSEISIVNRGSFSLDYNSISKKSGDFAANLIRKTPAFPSLS